MKNPIKRNNDYGDNFIDKLRERNEKLKRRNKNKDAIRELLSNDSSDKLDSKQVLYNGKDIGPMAEIIGISPIFLKAMLTISGLQPDFYLPFSFKKNPKAIEAAKALDFILFVRYYFGEHYLSKGLDEKLKQQYELLSGKER